MIVTVGSINMDLVVKVNRLPSVGETVIGSDYERYPGGKGANQAVAAVRLGAPVRLVGALGEDEYGDQLLHVIQSENIDSAWVKRAHGPSGAAFITVDRQGQNCIVVAPGSNNKLLPEDINSAMCDQAKVLLLQCEIPTATIRAAAKLGKEAGATVILNAAPASELAAEDYKNIDVLVVNEVEIGMLLGQPGVRNPKEAISLAKELLTRVWAVVVTLGAQGAVWVQGDESGFIEALNVNTIDTTAAGDAFVGALAVGLNDGRRLQDSLRFANICGALTTTKHGAQSSLPTRSDLESFMSGVVL